VKRLTSPRFFVGVCVAQSLVLCVLFEERDKIDTSNTQIHDLSLSWLSTDTSIKSGGIRLVLWAQTSKDLEHLAY
jgi:hypothetical protein